MKKFLAFAGFLACLVALPTTQAEAVRPGQTLSFQSVNYRTKFIRHRGFLGYITVIRSALDRKDASFRIVRGLWGKGTISFQSVNYPTHFLRHQGFRLKLHKRSGAPLYRKDASFYVRKGLAGGVSFESVNYKGHYIRHCSFQLFIDNNRKNNRKCSKNGNVFRKDVSFLPRKAFVSGKPGPRPTAGSVKLRLNSALSFQSVNYRTKFIRHRGYLGYITVIRSALDRKDASFIVRRGQWGAGSVSFESVNFPGYFLRHQGFRLKLHKRSGASLYRKDVSFYVRKGLARGGVSFESVNYKGHYIRHCSFQLFIDNNRKNNRKCSKNGNVFKMDVTFNLRPAFVRTAGKPGVRPTAGGKVPNYAALCKKSHKRCLQYSVRSCASMCRRSKNPNCKRSCPGYRRMMCRRSFGYCRATAGCRTRMMRCRNAVTRACKGNRSCMRIRTLGCSQGYQRCLRGRQCGHSASICMSGTSWYCLNRFGRNKAAVKKCIVDRRRRCSSSHNLCRRCRPALTACTYAVQRRCWKKCKNNSRCFSSCYRGAVRPCQNRYRACSKRYAYKPGKPGKPAVAIKPGKVGGCGSVNRCKAGLALLLRKPYIWAKRSPKAWVQTWAVFKRGYLVHCRSAVRGNKAGALSLQRVIVGQGDRIGPYCPRLHRRRFDCQSAPNRIAKASKGLLKLLSGKCKTGGGGASVAFQSVNYKTKFIRHRGYKGYITVIRSMLDRKDASFRIRKGLWGKGTVSFESVNFPGYFLRHQGFVIKLHKRSNAPLYRKDASFYIRRGLAKGGNSFESVNYRGHYIRHCSFRLFIDNNKRRNRACNPKVFKADVTFRRVRGFVR